MAEASMPRYAPVKFDQEEVAEVEKMSESNNEDYDFMMCMEKLKNPLYPEPDFCNHACKDFLSLIQHLREDHGAAMEKHVDYCVGCEILFDSPLQGIHHYLTKALMYEEFDMVRENSACHPAFKKDLKTYLGPIFDKIKVFCEDIQTSLRYEGRWLDEDMAEGVFDEKMAELEKDLTNLTIEDAESQSFDTIDCVEGSRV